MSNEKVKGITRRDFVKITGAGALAAGVGPFFLFPERPSHDVCQGARDIMSAEEAAQAAEKEVRRIFDKWK